MNSLEYVPSRFVMQIAEGCGNFINFNQENFIHFTEF